MAEIGEEAERMAEIGEEAEQMAEIGEEAERMAGVDDGHQYKSVRDLSQNLYNGYQNYSLLHV